jgi:hypothetical protein
MNWLATPRYGASKIQIKNLMMKTVDGPMCKVFHFWYWQTAYNIMQIFWCLVGPHAARNLIMGVIPSQINQYSDSQVFSVHHAISCSDNNFTPWSTVPIESFLFFADLYFINWLNFRYSKFLGYSLCCAMLADVYEFQTSISRGFYCLLSFLCWR